MSEPLVQVESGRGPAVSVTKQTLDKLPCPVCKASLDVTGYGLGNSVKCSNCDNWTYIPGTEKNLSFTIRRVFLSIVLPIAVGVIANFIHDELRPCEQRQSGGEIRS